jgi:hypothetical protein
MDLLDDFEQGGRRGLRSERQISTEMTRRCAQVIAGTFQKQHWLRGGEEAEEERKDRHDSLQEGQVRLFQDGQEGKDDPEKNDLDHQHAKEPLSGTRSYHDLEKGEKGSGG